MNASINTQSRASGPDFTVNTDHRGTHCFFTPENEAAKLFCERERPDSWLGNTVALPCSSGREFVSLIEAQGFTVLFEGVEVSW